MSEKRFVSEYVEIIDENGSRQAVCVTNNEHTVSFEVKDEYVAMDLCKKLNDQQATIKQLQGKVKRLNAFIVEQGLAIEYLKWNKEKVMFDE